MFGAIKLNFAPASSIKTTNICNLIIKLTGAICTLCWKLSLQAYSASKIDYFFFMYLHVQYTLHKCNKQHCKQDLVYRNVQNVHLFDVFSFPTEQ